MCTFAAKLETNSSSRYTFVMTGLPYLAENIKTLLRWGLITVVALFAIWFLWLTFSFTYKLIFPPPPTPPDIAFGKLRQPVVFNSNFAADLFTLDTPGSAVVTPPRVLKIFEVPEIEGEFASLDNAKKVARGAGLDSDPQQLSDNEWRFTSKKNPSKSLRFNIVTHNFIYSYDWIADSKALEGVFKTTDQAIIDKAKSSLNTFKSLKDDLKNGTFRVSYWKIVGNDRTAVGSFSEANATMVEFFRKDIGTENKLIEIDPTRSQVNVWLSPASGDKQILEINFTYYGYNKDSSATYPPKTGVQAFEDLKAGDAFIATGLSEPFESISITETSLAYLNPNTDQRTLQPIFVFKGVGLVRGEEKDFLAYVAAVSSDYQR